MAEKEPSFAADAQSTILDRYLVSLYWAITTMSTVGYGDIVPCNEHERVFSIVSMFVACGMFGYVLGSMQRLLAKFGEERLEFDRLLIRTMRAFRFHNVGWDLQHRVRKYLEHNFDIKTKTKMDPVLLQALSPALRNEVLLSLLLPTLQQFPLFMNSSRKLLTRVCAGCVTHRAGIGDMVWEAGSFGSSMYFVVTGIAARFEAETAEQRRTEYDPGMWFGERYLFVPKVVEDVVICATFAELLEVQQATFRTNMAEFPKMVATYREYQRKLLPGDDRCIPAAPAVVKSFTDFAEEDYLHAGGGGHMLQRSNTVFATSHMSKAAFVKSLTTSGRHQPVTGAKRSPTVALRSPGSRSP
jgi:hypothetical protein